MTSIGVLSVLSKEQVDAAIADSRTRGAYLTDVRNFFLSGELAVDFTEKYPNVESGSLRNSVDQNCKKFRAEQNGATPEYRIVKVQNGEKSHVVLINMDVYNLQSQSDEA